MLNAEKYKDKLIEIRSMGHYIAVINGEPMRCEDIGDCHTCRFVSPDVADCNIGVIDWMLEEYVEPKVDWSKVKVDTPILVSNDGHEWRKRYFSKYDDECVYAWRDGVTSWSKGEWDGDGFPWKYAKLAEDGDLDAIG